MRDGQPFGTFLLEESENDDLGLEMISCSIYNVAVFNFLK